MADQRLVRVSEEESLEEQKKEQERLDKEAKEKWEKAQAQGQFAGGPVALSGTTLSETYIGIGPLVIKTSRGEQKAESGDVVVVVVIQHDEPELEDEVFVVLLPAPVAELLLEPGPVEGKGMTNKEFAAYEEERAKRAKFKLDQKNKPSTPATPQIQSSPAGRLGTGVTSTASTAKPNPSR